MPNFDLSNYIPVNERLTLFYKDFPNGRILTELIEHDRETGFVMFKTSAYRQADDAMPAATGHAYESQGSSYVNKTSYIENCETSSVGRALALLGYEITKGIASREEMAKVQRHEQQQKPKPAPAPIADRIANVSKAIKELGGKVEPKAANETEQDYFESLVEQWNTLKSNKEGK